ncbi:MAG: sugar diacid utilization regulator [Actinomycetia bacterium]|nr:sugar diacid utilization regulator [Actinomycetes bacterium]
MTDPPDHRPGAWEDDVAQRKQLSSLQGLMALSMLMAQSDDERKIIELATTSVSSLGRVLLGGLHLVREGWTTTGPSLADPTVQSHVEAQLDSGTAGPVTVPGASWAWAYPLRSLGGHLGHLVVTADIAPTAKEVFQLQALAQHAATAIANARVHHREQATAGELRTANVTLEATVGALRRSTNIHRRLTDVVVTSGGQQGIADAIHNLTGHPIAVEDRHGHVQAWSGPGGPESYPPLTATARRRLVDRGLRERTPIRAGRRLMAVAAPGANLVGVLVLFDPAEVAGEQEYVALEHGATVLAMELARMQSVAEAELRLGRDLLETLLAGTTAQPSLDHAHALGYDLDRPHRVIVAERSNDADDDTFFHAIRRAARDSGIASLLVGRGGTVVLLSDRDGPWDGFSDAVTDELAGRTHCRIGVGGSYATPALVPRSHREARLALRLLEQAGGLEKVACFDQLGIYRILAEAGGVEAMADFVQEWLGALLDYDAHNGTAELMTTLGSYLENGRRQAVTANALSVHVSTVKYRLQRIQEISGLDLGDGDTQFNLQLATRTRTTLAALRDEAEL